MLHVAVEFLRVICNTVCKKLTNIMPKVLFRVSQHFGTYVQHDRFRFTSIATEHKEFSSSSRICSSGFDHSIDFHFQQGYWVTGEELQ